MQLWIIGFLYISALQIHIPTVEASPRGPPLAGGGFASYRSGGEQSSQFAEGLRDWFRNVKNRLLGGSDSQALPPAEAGKMMMELENEDPQERLRNNPGGFFLDLARLTFDPDRDWGFRLGQWYFIRKPSDEPAPGDWKSTNDPEWPTMDEGNDDTVAPPFVTTKSNDVTTIDALASGKESPEVTDPTIAVERKDTDNETRDNTGNMQSAEVLLPSE